MKSYSFDKFAIRGMSVADVDGDGKNEIVLMTPTRVIVYRFENDRMRELARFDEGAANDFRWLDVADMNGDGAPEFYLASYRSNELFSKILQFKNGAFKPLVRNDRTFYRLIRVRRPGKGEKIPDSEAFFAPGARAKGSTRRSMAQSAAITGRGEISRLPPPMRFRPT